MINNEVFLSIFCLACRAAALGRKKYLISRRFISFALSMRISLEREKKTFHFSAQQQATTEEDLLNSLMQTAVPVEKLPRIT